MDAASLFDERKADVAAFAQLVFRGGGREAHSRNGGSAPREPRGNVSESTDFAAENQQGLAAFPWTTSQSLLTPSYRRPASANVPVSRVLREAKLKAARQRRAAEGSRRGPPKVTAGDSLKSSPATRGPSTSADPVPSAMGFSRQEIRDRTYLWMSEPTERGVSSENLTMRASLQRATLTPSQKAHLRRLRIKRAHQRLLTPAQWVLWLRRRRRLWQRRRPVARKRHLVRQFALEYGRPVEPCRCCRGYAKRTSKAAQAKEARKLCAPTVKTPTWIKEAHRVVQWLPSHARLVKYFSYRRVTLAVQRVSVHAKAKCLPSLQKGRGGLPARNGGEDVVQVAMSNEPKRKGHRFLQRWATALGAHQHRQRLAKSSAETGKADTPLDSSLPAALGSTMLSELSHHCVYSLIPRASAPSSTVADLLDILDLRPTTDLSDAECAGVAVTLSPLVRHRQARQCATTVVHGHMWCLGAVHSTFDAQRSAISTLSRHTRVVPVVLVVPRDADHNANISDILLFCDVPVHFSRLALTRYCVQLISMWSPCTLHSTFASVVEYWRCISSTQDTVATLQWTLQRCARVFRQLRRRSCRSDDRLRKGTDPRAKKHRLPLKSEHSKYRVVGKKRSGNSLIEKDSGKGSRQHIRRWNKSSRETRLSNRQTPHLLLVAFPSLPAPFLRNCPSDGAPFVAAWRIGFLFRSQPSPISYADSSINGVAKLVATEGCKVDPVSTASVRRLYRTSMVSRRTHFQLARRFFGFLLTAPHLPTMSAVELPNGRTAAIRGRCRVLGFADRTSLLHLVGQPVFPLDYGLSRPSRAARQQRSQRSRPASRRPLVTKPRVKRHRDGESVESTSSRVAAVPVPSYAHTLDYYGNLSNAAFRVFARAADVSRKLLTLHGAVGTLLLRCRYSVEASTGLRVPLLERIGVVSSSAFFAQRFGCMLTPVWCCFPPSSAMDFSRADEEAHAAYLLAPPAFADELLHHSTFLAREDPPRQRWHSRHQRAFDLERGRAVRQLEAQLHDPLSCTPAHLIQWYA